MLYCILGKWKTDLWFDLDSVLARNIRLHGSDLHQNAIIHEI